jgi:DNA-directed RNA polymerase specialized sigma24 family protein
VTRFTHPVSEPLRTFAGSPSPETFQPLVDRHLQLVYSTALARTGDPDGASEIARAVFHVLERRARKLPRRVVLPAWLFRTTLLCARAWQRAQKRKPAAARTANATPAPEPGRILPAQWIDAVARLPEKLARVVAVHHLAGDDLEAAARVLRISRSRVERRLRKACKKLARRLRRYDRALRPEAVGNELDAFRSVPLPPDLATEIAAAVPSPEPGHSAALVRATLWALVRARWKRRFILALRAIGCLIILLLGAAWYLAHLWQTGELMVWMMERSSRSLVKEFPELAIPPRPWPADGIRPAPEPVFTAADLYRTTNIVFTRLSFTGPDWDGLEPSRIPPIQVIRPDGSLQLRNPNAQRSGLAGVLGYDFNWVPADLDIAGQSFSRVAVRFRGNGTYVGSLYGLKRPLKVDLNKFTKGQALAGLDSLSFANLVEDSSYMHDTLGYELFRQAGVPSPRTAFTWLTVAVRGQWEEKPFGLYLLVESVDEDFAGEWFGTKKAPIFKPVTYDLFKDLGSDWAAYAEIYDLKTEATDGQKARLIEFARLVTHAPDAEFSSRVGEFLDLEEFAGFLGGLVLLSSYDGFLSTGQNFFLYMNPKDQRFGFIPWDLDHAWGGFGMAGDTEAREQASIWKPWAFPNRFLERVLAVESFRKIYRARLETMLATVFVPDRLMARIDELGRILRAPIGAESAFRLRRFDQSIGTNWVAIPARGDQMGPRRPPHPLKKFITKRAESVRDQLDGKTSGTIVNMKF